MSQVGGTLDGRLGYAVKRLQQAVRVSAEGQLRPLGLTMPQYAVLAALADRPGLSNSELARRCFVTRQTMNEVLGGLQRAGLVNRAAHPRDGRVQRTELTARAYGLAGRADDVLARVEKQMTRGLTSSQRRQLLELLRTCISNLEAEHAGDR